jgi:hypothetical protein
MIEKTVYIAVDGKQFETKEQCLRHEQRLEIFKSATALKNFCKTSRCTSHCESCPFFSCEDGKCFFRDNPSIPANWNFDKEEE